MAIKVLAIRTDFKHHGENHGYKQILKGIKPEITIGINEREEGQATPRLFRKYQWLFEFQAKKHEEQIDLIHILYGEDYFRWSGRIFRKTPVVATFHQPADILEKEVLKGNIRGRIGQLTHWLNKNRFKQLAAAIVTSTSQKEVLKKVMDEKKIHVIPLGIYLSEINEKYRKHKPVARQKPTIITLGHWLRDWPFYFKMVESCPDWDFQLINRRLNRELVDKCTHYPNLTYYNDIENAMVDDLLLEATAQFLPVTGLAASNAIVQAFGLGCPLVLTNVNGSGEYSKPGNAFVITYEPDNVADCARALRSIIDLPQNKKTQLRQEAHLYAQDFSWQSITKRTIDLYQSIVK